MRTSVSLWRQLAEQAREATEAQDSSSSMKIDWYDLHVESSTLFVDLFSCAHALTALKVPKSWGRKWLFRISPGIGCSYALNRLLCRWFEVERDELAIFRLQPIEPFLSAIVLGVPVTSDKLCAEVLWCPRNFFLGNLHNVNFAIYPHLVGKKGSVQFPLIDLLFVECAADADISSANIKLTLDFSHTGCVMIQADTAAAILLDAGSAGRNALYAVRLGDDLELECYADVEAYLHRLIAWTEEYELGPCPATWHTLTCQLGESLPGFELYMWAFTMPPNFWN